MTAAVRHHYNSLFQTSPHQFNQLSNIAPARALLSLESQATFPVLLPKFLLEPLSLDAICVGMKLPLSVVKLHVYDESSIICGETRSESFLLLSARTKGLVGHHTYKCRYVSKKYH